MAPEVFFNVCYGDPSPPKAIRDLHTFSPAVLEDHCRHRIQRAEYPGVVPEKGRRVRGIYATGLTGANMGKLDGFEGSEYKRVQVKVQLLQSIDTEVATGGTKETFVYIFLHPEILVKQEWDFEEFRRDRLRFWTRGGIEFGDGEPFSRR
ncbi:hypothetical protein HIM_08832 [Hirsutella minnesotensis 3608]|uniref:Putative gamma-glutamylcyclotransferase n=1 Tax=Hirsutella minnesotensis 3608 TaxID=1043627 RepID=A0A0F7ZY28_9HYPO|nr:hypothetical protein HIM_08832 [Hirsutella minnesotensis 3608]